MKRNIFFLSKNGDKTVKKAVSRIPNPNMVVPPYLSPNIPPHGPNRYPIENALRMNPIVFVSQSNSGRLLKDFQKKKKKKKTPGQKINF